MNIQRFASLSVLALASMTLLVSSCNRSSDIPSTSGKNPLVVMTPSLDNLVMSLNSYAFDLIQREAIQESDVWTGSPYSLARMMTTLLTGAEGATRDSLVGALHLSGCSLDEVNKLHKKLSKTLVTKRQRSLNSAALICLGSSIKPQRPWIRSVRDYFDVKILQDASPQKINSWVKTATKGKITQIATEEDYPTGLQAFDALYFEGLWTLPFKEEDTEDFEFYRACGDTIMTPMLNHAGPHDYFPEDFRYLETDQFQAMDLPYTDHRTSMTVFLPKDDLTEFVQSLTDSCWRSWLPQFKPLASYLNGDARAIFAMPKVNLTMDIDYKGTLSEQGLELIFDIQRADFTGIAAKTSQENLFVNSIGQRMLLEISEEKTVAVAVTYEVMAMSAAPEEIPIIIKMVVNRPYLLLIKDNPTGLILMAGIVRNLPGEKVSADPFAFQLEDDSLTQKEIKRMQRELKRSERQLKLKEKASEK